MPSIHISDVSSFKRCRRRWGWSSRQGLGLTSTRPSEPFFTGSTAHYALEHYYSSGTAPQSSIGAYIKKRVKQNELLRQDHRAFLRQEALLVRGMIEHYILWARAQRDEFADDKFEFLDQETEFKVELLKDSPVGTIYLEGRWDGLWRHRDTGRLYIPEFKTTGTGLERFTYSLPMQEQATAYAWAASQVLGEMPAGVIYTVLAKKLPEFPDVLKNGLLSKRISRKITAEWYIHCIRKHHWGISNENIMALYGDTIQKFADEDNTFFTRAVVYKTAHELQSMYQELQLLALEMLQRPVIYATRGWLCTNCPFYAPCVEQDRGQDYLITLEEDFMRRDDLVEVEEE